MVGFLLTIMHMTLYMGGWLIHCILFGSSASMSK